jgi:hypothetical protein
LLHAGSWPDGLAFAPDDKSFLTTDIFRPVRDGPTWCEVRRWKTKGLAFGEASIFRSSPFSGLGSKRALFAPDGDLFVVSDGDTVRFFDAGSNRQVGPAISLASQRLTIKDMAFHPRGEWLAAALEMNHGVALIPVPRPVSGETKRLRLWIEVAAGKDLDETGAVIDLDAKTWRERYDRLQKLGGVPLP